MILRDLEQGIVTEAGRSTRLASGCGRDSILGLGDHFACRIGERRMTNVVRRASRRRSVAKVGQQPPIVFFVGRLGPANRAE